MWNRPTAIGKFLKDLKFNSVTREQPLSQQLITCLCTVSSLDTAGHYRDNCRSALSSLPLISSINLVTFEGFLR